MRRGIILYIGGRFLQSLLVLWVIVTFLFFLFRLAPGSPLAAYIDTTFTAEQEAALMARFGLDKPVYMQYFIYVGNLMRGELGESFTSSGQSVLDVLLDDLPNTLYLTITSLFLAYFVGVIGGVVMAAQRGMRFEKIGITFTLMTRAAPQFWVGMILLYLFSYP
ncbi:MAG: ABC transporter permease [Anaerolineae bacterium]|nr:ABC transporter permease [Anaerolineae bacterium]